MTLNVECNVRYGVKIKLPKIFLQIISAERKTGDFILPHSFTIAISIEGFYI